MNKRPVFSEDGDHRPKTDTVFNKLMGKVNPSSQEENHLPGSVFGFLFGFSPKTISAEDFLSSLSKINPWNFHFHGTPVTQPAWGPSRAVFSGEMLGH